MYDLCEENDGLDKVASPNRMEEARIEILKSLAEKYFKGLYCYDDIPKCEILINKEVPESGEAIMYRTYDKDKNHLGVSKKYDVVCIRMTNAILNEGSLADALPVYIGVLESHIPFVKLILSGLTEEQIRGKQPIYNKYILEACPQENLEYYYDFFKKYGNLTTERQIQRYIAESEFLPWR